MAPKLVILVCSLFVNGMVIAGGHSSRHASNVPLERAPQSYDDIVVVESPIIDLDDADKAPQLASHSEHHQLTPGAPAGYGFTATAARYHGPPAVTVVLPDGTLADTPEVVEARKAHLIAIEHARSLASADDDDGSYDPRKYEHEYEEHAGTYHSHQGLAQQNLGVGVVQAPLNNLYQRPLPLQQPYNAQYFSSNVQRHLPAGQHYGTHGYITPEHTQAFVSRNNVNTHHLESLAARGQLSRQYIDTLIAQYPQNRRYLEQLLYQQTPDSHFTDTFAFAGVRQRPLHGGTVHNDHQQYFTSVNVESSRNTHSGNYVNPSVHYDHVEQYPSVVAVQPPVNDAVYVKPIKKVVKVPIRMNNNLDHSLVDHTTEQYSNVVAVESPIKNAVGTGVIMKEVEGYSASGSEHATLGSNVYSNIPMQSTLDNPVDPNFTYKSTVIHTKNPNPIDTRFDQPPIGKNYVGNVHYVPAPVNGQFVAINNLAVTHPYSKPYDGPLAHVNFQESGYLSDTPEVAAAKAAHLTAHKIAREKHAQWIARYHSVH